MPRGPLPDYRKRKEPILDDWVLASVQASGGIGKHHPQTGHYGELKITGLTDREEADEYRRALHRCAYYLHRTRVADVSMKSDAPVREPDGTYSITFRAADKTFARKAIIDKYGPDPSKWPYNPRARGGRRSA